MNLDEGKMWRDVVTHRDGSSWLGHRDWWPWLSYRDWIIVTVSQWLGRRGHFVTDISSPDCVIHGEWYISLCSFLTSGYSGITNWNVRYQLWITWLCTTWLWRPSKSRSQQIPLYYKCSPPPALPGSTTVHYTHNQLWSKSNQWVGPVWSTLQVHRHADWLKRTLNITNLFSIP